MKCYNCGRQMTEGDRFCSTCGQLLEVHRFNLKHFFNEFFHAFTHTDRSALFLLKGLVVKPGLVLREYVIERKRKKYFNPFTFLILILGFTVFMSSVFRPLEKSKSIFQEQIATANTAQKKALLLTIEEKQAKINQFMEKRMNVVVFITAPFMALAFWLVFKGKGLNYAEHLVTYLMLTSILSLISTVVFIPMMAALPYEQFYIVAIANIIVQLLYTTFAYSSFLKLKGFAEKSMVVVANILGIVFWMAIMMMITLIYIAGF